MARKRMFDMEIIDTDLFLDMPVSVQNLYFHLGMRADDDGFVSNPKKICKTINSGDDDLKILILKNFIIPFESGVIVIKHWKLNNYLRKDRYIETIYSKEKSQLIEDNNGVYSLGIPNDNQMTTNGLPSIEENSIEENSIEENSIEENSIEENSIIYKDKNKYKQKDKQKNKKIYKIYGQYQRVKLTDDELAKLNKEFGEKYILDMIKDVDEYVEKNNNKNGYTNFNLVIRKAIRDNWFAQTPYKTYNKPLHVSFADIDITENPISTAYEVREE